jgi:hypothetical protein
MEPQGPAIAHAAADGAGAALLPAAAAADLNPPAASSGQMQIQQRRYRLVPLSLTVSDAPLICACCCAGAVLATLGARPRVDADGQPVCERCGRRLSRCKGKLYACPPGKCCHSCYNETHSGSSSAPKQQRSKRPYDTLQPTQRWKRRKQARATVAEVLEQLGVPLAALQPPSTPSPAELLHLTTAEREHPHRSITPHPKRTDDDRM